MVDIVCEGALNNGSISVPVAKDNSLVTCQCRAGNRDCEGMETRQVISVVSFRVEFVVCGSLIGRTSGTSMTRVNDGTGLCI